MKINCSYRSFGVKDFMKVRDGSRVDGSDTLDEKICKKREWIIPGAVS